ncbi:hypothetical protein [Nocardioides limicola]|uniref:hypothetical protein n=1 Tax=Nocardioides limicola TaxID=2803368 RepID=UPI00193AEE80|nr:hypothetical protein [Nocardioides sp. DJM-14]
MKTRVPAALAAVMLTCTLTTAIGSAPTQAASPESGFQIAANGQANGGWIGARRVRGQTAYRIQPGKQATSGRYRPFVRRGSADAVPVRSDRALRRTAWILSRYGGRRHDVQAAAVDAAVLHLTRGRSWRIGKRDGRARIRQTPYPRQVGDWARQMLRESQQYAGPYRLTLDVGRAEAGSGSRSRVQLLSARDAAIEGITVRFRYDGVVRTAVTNRHGIAAVTFTAKAGAHSVTARALGLPEVALHVAKPRRRGSMVAAAGRTRTMSASAPLVAAGAQQVRITPPTTALLAGRDLGHRYTISGAIGSQQVRQRVHGPFTTSGEASCATSSSQSTSTTRTGDGTWAFSAYATPRSGWYRRHLVAAGNSSTHAADVCGPAVRVMKQSGIGQARRGDTRVKAPGQVFGIDVTLSGFDRTETRTVRAHLYGPFGSREAARYYDCAGDPHAKRRKTVPKSMSGNQSAAFTTTIARKNAGHYVWRAVNPDGDLIKGASTGCGVHFHVKAE